jgi:hypothetical protein
VNPAGKQKKFLQVAREETDGFLKAFFVEHLEWFFALLILAGLAVYLWRQNTRLRRAEAQLKPAVSPKATNPEINIGAEVPVNIDPFLRAKRMLANGDPSGFYRELNQTTWEILRDKLQVRSSELNKHHIGDLLRAKGLDNAKIALLEKTLNECELNLYTPDHNETNMQQTLFHAEQALKYLEEGLGEMRSPQLS